MEISKWMVVEIGGYTFKKYPSEKTSTVNVYRNGREVDMFGHDGIGTDFDKLVEVCQEHYNEMIEG